ICLENAAARGTVAPAAPCLRRERWNPQPVRRRHVQVSDTETWLGRTLPCKCDLQIARPRPHRPRPGVRHQDLATLDVAESATAGEGASQGARSSGAPLAADS